MLMGWTWSANTRGSKPPQLRICKTPRQLCKLHPTRHLATRARIGLLRTRHPTYATAHSGVSSSSYGSTQTPHALKWATCETLCEMHWNPSFCLCTGMLSKPRTHAQRCWKPSSLEDAKRTTDLWYGVWVHTIGMKMAISGVKNLERN